MSMRKRGKGNSATNLKHWSLKLFQNLIQIKSLLHPISDGLGEGTEGTPARKAHPEEVAKPRGFDRGLQVSNILVDCGSGVT